MQKALICALSIRLTSQRHCRARSFQGAAYTNNRRAIACRRCSEGWLRDTSTRRVWASDSICWYCRAAACSSAGADTSLRRLDAAPTSTCASTGGAAPGVGGGGGGGAGAGGQQESAARRPRGWGHHAGRGAEGGAGKAHAGIIDKTARPK